MSNSMEILGKGRTCHATPAKARALLALAAPLFAVGYAVAMLWTRGHSMFDYPLLIREGHLDVFRQGVGWVALVFWIARYWPSAIEALRSSCLIWEENGTLRFTMGAMVTKSEIESIEIRHGIASKAIEVRCQNGRIWRQSIMLTEERKLDILKALRDLVDRDKKIKVTTHQTEFSGNDT